MGPRRQHYLYAHVALRDVFHYDPPKIMAILRGPRGEEFVQTLWRDLAGQIAEGERLEDGPPTVDVAEQKGREIVLVWMPLPAGVTECHAVALVTEMARRGPGLAAGTVPHYFTLERGEDLEGGERTVLCGWAEQGEDFTHYNLGDGPEPTRAAFLDAVGAHLDGRI